MAFRPEVHVGDVGTLYRVRLRDGTGPVDPTDADTKQIIFELSDGNVVTKTATVVEDDPEFYLTYEVQAADGYSGQEFHPQAGTMKMQGRLAWSDGSTFSTDILTKDEDGLPLRVYGNIGAGADVVVPTPPASDDFIQVGTGAEEVTYLEKCREQFSVTDFGALGDGSTDDKDDFDEALDAVEALDDRRGRMVHVPIGIFPLSDRIELTRRTILTGEGGQSDGRYADDPQGNTTLLCMQGGILIDGVSPSVGYYSLIRNMEIRSSTQSGDDGVHMVGRAFLENTHIVGFGGSAVRIEASTPTGNANGWRVAFSRLEDSLLDGLKVAGTDANAGLALQVDSANNTGKGFDVTATHPSTFVACQDEGNSIGVKSANGSVWVGHYNEGGQSPNEVDEPDIILGGKWFSGFASGMEPMRIADNKVNIGTTMAADWVTAGEGSTQSRGVYVDQGASITGLAFGLGATGRTDHQMTSYAATGTLFKVEQGTASDGGAAIFGFGDAVSALYLKGFGNGEATAEGASDLANVIVDGAKRSGTAITAIGATANLAAFQNADVNKSFIKGDGTYAVRGTYGTRQAPDHLLVGTSSITGMAAGLRIDALTSTNEITSIRGTGRIAHNVTTLADTTTLKLEQIAGSSGGIQTLYFTSDKQALDLRTIATTEDTVSTSSAVAPLSFNVLKKSGTGTTAIGSTGNLAVIANASATRTIVKGDGSILMVAGDLGATGTRVTKGWFTSLESTNAPTVSGAAVYFVGGTDVALADGGTGKSSITAKSIWVSNSANVLTEVTPGAGNSIRMNAGATAWEAYTPAGGGGGGALAYVGTAVDYAALTTDYFIKVTGVGKTVTLPTAVSASGKDYVIDNAAASGVTTVATTSGQTINGSTTQTVAVNNALSVYSDGANWRIY